MVFCLVGVIIITFFRNKRGVAAVPPVLSGVLFSWCNNSFLFEQLGQWAATRRDVFSDEVTSVLSALHSQGMFNLLLIKAM